MKTVRTFFVATLIVLMATGVQAQFTSSKSKSGSSGQSSSEQTKTRAQDIAFLEQKAVIIERQVNAGQVNEEMVAKHKAEILDVINRELARSRYDLYDLRQQLNSVPGGKLSQEGRALQIEIQQMEGRYNMQKRIKGEAEAFTLSKANDPKYLSTVRGNYNYFIRSMKENLKYEDQVAPGDPNGEGGAPKGNGTSTQKGGSNVIVTKGGKQTKTGGSGMMGGMSSSGGSSAKGSGKTGTGTGTANTGGQNVQTGNPDSEKFEQMRIAADYQRQQHSSKVAISSSTRSLKSALANGDTDVLNRSVQKLTSNIEKDIDADKRILRQLDHGELSQTDLDAAQIRSQLSQKRSLLEQIQSVKLPAQKEQIFKLITDYLNLLQ